MSFHKKETEKIELVARPETDQTQLNLLTDMVENNYLKKTPDQVRTTRDIFFTTWAEERGEWLSFVLEFQFSGGRCLKRLFYSLCPALRASLARFGGQRRHSTHHLVTYN